MSNDNTNIFIILWLKKIKLCRQNKKIFKYMFYFIFNVRELINSSAVAQMFFITLYIIKFDFQ